MSKNDAFNSLIRLFNITNDKKKLEANKDKESAEEHPIVVVNNNKDIAVPNILRSDMNFLKYPFFDLTKTSKRDKIEIKEKIKNDKGEEIVVTWKVTRPLDYSFPSAFDKKVDKVIEKAVNDLPKPITNPIKLGSFRDICKQMNVVVSGKTVNEIKSSLKRMVLTGIESKGTFFLRNEKRFIDDTFHKYERVISAGQELPDGKKADAVYIMLGSWYLQNLNDNYVVPLDHDYYLSLEGTITTRMYEFLSLKIFPALENRKDYVQIGYDRHCRYFPLTPQDKLWKAKKQLLKAHNGLGLDKNIPDEKKFIRNVEWFDSKDKKDWTVRYYIGERAKREWRRNTKRELGRSAKQVAKKVEVKKENIEGPKNINVYNNPAVQKLVKRGITDTIAIKLAKEYPNRIEKKISEFDYIVQNKYHLLHKSPSGFLRKSIEGNWEPPKGYVTLDQRKKIEKDQEEQKRKQEWNGKVEEYKKWVESPDESKIYWEFTKWKKGIEKKGLVPTQEEIELKKKRLISKLLSNEDMQKTIFGKIVFSNTRDLFNNNG
jgi:hypothetical protein